MTGGNEIGFLCFKVQRKPIFPYILSHWRENVFFMHFMQKIFDLTVYLC